ncbi:beta family protein [Nocardioides sp. MH1]|uniref:beta family protein n=1 Tax=Nocardioides sp. MH1 TaxID=3242490 RepID=UPI0035214AAF
MLGFGADKYVPILLTKRGERRALESLDPVIGDEVRPLLVVHEADWDYDLGQPKKSLDEHLSALPSDLAGSWKRPAFIDMNDLGDGPLASGVHPLSWFHGEAASQGLELTPVVSTISTDPYLDAAQGLVADGSDVCVRLAVDEWPAGAGPADIDELLAHLGTSPAECHLVLDMRDDVGAAAARLALAELRTLPYLNDWRSLTVASTAIPESMPPGSGLHVLPRHDWRIYAALRSGAVAPPLPRQPTFGDYAVNGASLGVDINPAVMQISATLRYTTDNEWLVAKGGLFKAHGGKSQGGMAVPPAASLLVSHPSYEAGHCAFEDWLAPVAAGQSGSNPEAWRRYATHHHITKTVPQIASLGAP